MDKIVQQGLKVDFHIHSSASFKKDGALVKDGTIENVPVLLSKLQENSIDMFAITDHDSFDYSIYHALKEHEGNKFKKILPGIEFSVGIETDGENGVKEIKQVHVIAIFDDSDDEKIKELEKLLSSKTYDTKESKKSGDFQMFKENTFREILQKSDMNVCLIAHQKNSPTSRNQSTPDAMALGEEKFNELINYGYFEAYEFKTTNSHALHAIFKKRSNENYEKVRFITGSDCHQWDVYPRHDESSKEGNMSPTYLKCLPTFRGLAMALTDDTRIQCNKDFFLNSINYLKSIDYSIKGMKFSIPLSKGINAIIGDNSKGKSMFLHALTNYSKANSGSLKKDKKQEYKNYLKSKDISITKIDGLNYQFDSQGEIRKTFELGNFFSNPLINKFRPEDTDPSELKEKLQNSFESYYSALANKFSFDQSLSDFFKKYIVLDVEPAPGVSLQLQKIPKRSFESNNNFKAVLKNLGKALTFIDEALKSIKNTSDNTLLNDARSKIEFLKNKYSKNLELVDFHNTIKECINSSIDTLIALQRDIQTNEEKTWGIFEESSDDFGDSIATLLKNKGCIKPFKFTLAKFTPNYKSHILGDAELVSRFSSNKAYYDSSFCNQLLSNITKQTTKINQLLDIPNLRKDELLSFLKDKDESPSDDPINIIRTKINEEIDNELKPIQVVIEKGKDITASYSAGFNATQYLSILTHDKTHTIYIIDQPEDDISQTSIKSTVVKDLKTMSRDKQIILVTHNPQFVVNLDVDNVIYFHDSNEGNLQIESGALEYKDQNIDILKIVSDNLDGGVDSLRKRWKRYEKTITNETNE